MARSLRAFELYIFILLFIVLFGQVSSAVFIFFMFVFHGSYVYYNGKVRQHCAGSRNCSARACCPSHDVPLSPNKFKWNPLHPHPAAFSPQVTSAWVETDFRAIVRRHLTAFTSCRLLL
jgi:hypothetical protein